MGWTGNYAAKLVEQRTGTPPTQVRLPGAGKDFSLRVHSQCRLSIGVRTSPCAIARNYICAHAKDAVDAVDYGNTRHPACTVGWVARLCRSWLSSGKQS